jgi:cellobiose-specific phosphotransferase system component IIC
MSPLLAVEPTLREKVVDAVVEAFFRFLPVAVIAVAFGVVYWLVRRRASERETAKRRAWLADRRAKRGAEKNTPADR